MTDKVDGPPIKRHEHHGHLYAEPEEDRKITIADAAKAHDPCLDEDACVHGGPCPHHGG